MIDRISSESSGDMNPPLKFPLFVLIILLLNPSLSSSFCPPLCSCNDNSLSVNCHEASNLRMVPIFLNPQTKFLSLANNQIRDISMSFQFYSELQVLDFSQNKISSIGENNFENLRNLLKLNGSFNGLHELEADAFLGLSALRVLDLSANHLERIHGRVFSGLGGLRELYLDRNRLDSLDWDLFQGLESLETLSAKYNFLRVLQPPTRPSIPVASLTLAALPTTLSNSIVPVPIPWTLKNVRRVDMSWNQITRIKDGGLSVFSGLVDLNLCCNYIHTVEDRAFVPYPAGSLTRVNLSQNRLTRIPTESLEKLGSTLTHLDLSSNRISDQIPPNAFRNLLTLRVLRLSDNPSISTIDPTALIDNVNLVEFEADHLSNLTAVPVGLFNNKPFLRIFSLRFAQVTVLPEELLQNSQYSGLMSTLKLVGNPLDCNCSSLHLFQYIHSGQQGSMTSTSTFPKNKSLIHHDEDPSSLGHVQCATPTHLHGALLQDLRLSDFEHCFEKVFFATEHFEILVIGLGALIVLTVVTLIGVKLCCVHGLCEKSCSRSRWCKCRCKCRNKGDKEEKDEKEPGFCCRVNGNGTIPRDREYPTIVAAKKVLNVNSDEFRAVTGPPIPMAMTMTMNRGRAVGIGGGGIGGFGTLYSSHSPSSHSNHSSNSPSTGHSSVPINMTPLNLNGGGPSPLDLDGYLHLHHSSRKNSGHNHGHNHSNNKLRFDPKMQMQMHLMESASPTGNSGQQHPPMILHYEYDYPEYLTAVGTAARNNHQHHHRVKQVPSVLV